MADESTTARPYARAIFEIARDAGTFDAWSGRLEFWAALVEDPDMHKRLAAPGMAAKDKAGLIETVAADGMDDDSRNFLRLLAENERLLLMPDIARTFELLKGDEEGEIEAHVVSAYPLSDEQSEAISDALSRRLSRRVRLSSEVDEALIGGAIIHAGDLVIDGSIRGRLDGLQREVAA